MSRLKRPLELSNCLFCLDKIVKSEARDEDAYGEVETCVPNFKLVCEYLVGRNSRLNLFCRGLEAPGCLCMDCYEVAVKITKLHQQIEKAAAEIRFIIQRNENEGCSTGTGRKGRKRQSSSGVRKPGGVTDKCKELVDRFKHLARNSQAVEEPQEEFDNPQRNEEETVAPVPVVVKIKVRRKPVRVKPKREPIIPVESPVVARRRKVVPSTEVEAVKNAEDEELLEDSLGNEDGDPDYILENGPEAEQRSKTNDKDEDWSPEKEDDRKLKKRKASLMNTSASTAKRPKGGRGHTCNECGKHFAHLSQFLLHRSSHRKALNSTLAEYFDTIYKKRDGKKRAVRIKKCKLCNFSSAVNGMQRYMEHLLSHEEDATPSPNGKATFHSCNFCSETFTLKANLVFHKLWVHDPSQSRLKCDICGDSSPDYGSKEELIAHLKLHGDKVHSCKSCPLSYSTLDRCLQHMLKHAPSKRLFCPECDALPPFTSIYSLYKHCSVEHKELKKMFDCSSCGKSFLTADLLRLHTKKIHRNFDDKDGERCTRCADGIIYHTRESLDIHIRKEHCSKAKLKCEQCERTFSFPVQLRNHVATAHEGLRFLCPHCPKNYSDRFSLEGHIRIHSGEAGFTCPTCGKEFCTKNGLKLHEKSHQELPKDPICVCEVCGKQQYTEDQLRRHMLRSHTEKRYQCSGCSLQFKRRDHLKSHEIIHTGARPHECQVCKKGFNRSDILRVHMKGVHGIIVETKVARKPESKP